jgi:GDP-fucose transporter C1
MDDNYLPQNRIQTLLGYWAFNDIITAGRVLGIFLILGGGALYTWAKDKEMTAKNVSEPNYIPMTQQDLDGDEDDDAMDGDGRKA